MATTKLKPIELFVPFTNITRREEDGAMIVEGYCYVNPRVKGDRFNIPRAAMEAATPGYTEFPAVREMHQPIAAGRGLEVIWDEKGCFLRSECVDESTQKKIDKKVLRGYSIGVNALTVRGDDVESLDWVETSYVDRPKDPDAVFLYRADGFDWDAEVEVLVLPDVASLPEGSDPLPDTAGGATPAVPSEPAAPALSLPSSDSSAAPAAEVAPAADPMADPAAGDLSPSEEVDRAAMCAALVRAGTPEDMLDQLDVAAMYALLPAEERAQTTQTVPIRENLEGPAKGNVPLPKGMPPPPKPGTGYPSPAKPPAIPPGMMPNRKRGHVAVMADGCWGLYPSLEDNQIIGVFLDLSDATEALRRYAGEPLERVIKHEGDKWVVYSESGKKLGEHDTEEEAKKQLQAIEIEKHKDEEGATQPKGERVARMEGEAPKPRSYDEARGDRASSELAYSIEDAYMALMDSFYSILGSDAENKGDLIRESAKQYAAHIEEMCKAKAERGEMEPFLERLAELAEPPPDPPVSRSNGREDVTALLTRATTAEAELSRVQAAEQEARQRLAAAEAEVQRLRDDPAPAKRVIRFPHALDRAFLDQMGGEEAAQVERLKDAYPAAKAAAEAEARTGDGRGGKAYVQWMTLRAQLAEHGVSFD